MENKEVLQKLNDVLESVSEVKHEVKTLRVEHEVRFDNIDEKLEELTASAKAVDKLLESYPVERITRIETHLNLPSFVSTHGEE